jgi:hypothetical protein
MFALARNCIILAGVEPDTYTCVGNSRLGGLPDVTDDFVWPVEQSFMAQLNLSETTPLDTDKLLPDKGMLYFFMGSDEDASDIPISIIWKDVSAKDLRRASPPAEYEAVADGADPSLCEPKVIYQPFSLKMTQSISLPETGSHYFTQVFGEHITTEFEDAYVAVNEKIDRSSESVLGVSPPPRRIGVHRLFGYGCMLVEELEVLACYKRLGVDPDFHWLTVEKIDQQIGVYNADSPGYKNRESLIKTRKEQRSKLEQLSSEQLSDYRRQVDDWTLLFQLDSDFNASMCFWDAGMIHFLMHKDELARREFDRAHAELTSF